MKDKSQFNQMSFHEARRQRLRTALETAGQHAYFAWTPATMELLHGYGEGAAERFLALGFHADGRVAFVGPGLSENQARRAGIQDVRSWRDGEDPIALFKSLAKEWDLTSGIIAVDDELPALMLLDMQKALPGALFVSGGHALGEVTRQKGPDELAKMKRAGEIADRAFDLVTPHIRAGMTELEIDERLRDAMKSLGGTPAFSIVAAGAAAAEPHHLSENTPVLEGQGIIMDFGCDFEGYKSDITRTVCVGQPSAELSEAYRIVLRAHKAAREAMTVGTPCSVVDRVARDVIESAGFGDAFPHRIGHGIGMRVHEVPYLVGDNDDLLRVGDCTSIEPGIYLEGRYGVRIENIVTVAESGCVSLNAEPAEEILVVGA